MGSFAINTFGGSPTDVAVPPIFENMQTAINIRTGSIALKVTRMNLFFSFDRKCNFRLWI